MSQRHHTDGELAVVAARAVLGGLRGLVEEREVLLAERERLTRLRDDAMGLVEGVSRVLAGRGAPPALSPREAALLAYLAGRAGETVSAEELLTNVWGEPADARSVRVHVSLLRAKLRRSGDGRVIRTRRGVGYELVSPDGHVAPGPAPGRADGALRVE